MAEQQPQQQQKNENTPENEIRVGQRRSEAYVRIAEGLLINYDELLLTGLGNSMWKVSPILRIGHDKFFSNQNSCICGWNPQAPRIRCHWKYVPSVLRVELCMSRVLSEPIHIMRYSLRRSEVETSMIEGDYRSSGIAKILIKMRRAPDAKAKLEKIAEERKNESVCPLHLCFTHYFALHAFVAPHSGCFCWYRTHLLLLTGIGKARERTRREGERTRIWPLTVKKHKKVS